MSTEPTSTLSLINSLSDALSSVSTAFPGDTQVLLPPSDGISLLDVKNDLLLSYLQNLVFLIILRLRDERSHGSADATNLNEAIVKKLIELRVYMERGIRPLEGKLRYQIDKVLRAAEDADRIAAQKSTSSKKQKKKNKNRRADDGSDISNEESQSDRNSDASEEDDDDQDDEEMQEMMHRPNTSALAQKARADQRTSAKSRSTTATGVYKPPRITPTAMPLPTSGHDRSSDGLSRRRKSNLVDEYIDEEMSSAPRAQPSIGSNNTILARGRGGMSDRDRAKEKERTEYEERNLVRLPAESKAERRKAKARGERDRRDMFGGEDWTGLGGMGDRINKSVAGKGPSSALARREKRKTFTEDGPRGDGTGIGDAFDKRRKVLDDRAERKRRKRG